MVETKNLLDVNFMELVTLKNDFQVFYFFLGKFSEIVFWELILKLWFGKAHSPKDAGYPKSTHLPNLWESMDVKVLSYGLGSHLGYTTSR